MFKMRDDQVAAIEEESLERNLLEIEQHLHMHFPAKTNALGVSDTRAFAEESYDIALDMGIEQLPNIMRFTDLRFSLGASFMQDPDFPWAASILKDDSFPSPDSKVEKMAQIAAKLGESK